MELRDIAPLVSLLVTLVTLAYMVGQLRSVFTTRDQFTNFEKEIRAELSKRDRESISTHNQFVTHEELKALEKEITEDFRELKTEVKEGLGKISGQYQFLLESVTGLASQLTKKGS